MDGTGSKESPSVLLDSASPQPTIAALARSCLETFQKCLDKAAEVHPRESTLVENQIARFSVWTANSGAFAPSRASLDHRLREALDVQDAVGGLLEAIELRAQSCLSSLYSVDSSILERPPEAINPNFDEALEGISQNIGLLHRLSNTIRRASKETHKQKAAVEFRIKDEEGNVIETFLEEVFSYQIRDRFPEASENIRRRLAKSMLSRRKRILYRRSRYHSLPTKNQDEPAQPLILRHTVRMTPNQNVSKGADHENTGAQGRPKTREEPKSILGSTAMTATTLAPDHFKKASAPSVVSMSKTVALSQHDDLSFPPAPCGVLRQRFNRIKAQRDAELALVLEGMHIDAKQSEVVLQDMGKRIGKSVVTTVADAKATHREALKKAWEDCLNAVGEVICPFCFCTLPISEVADDRKWREHVKGDLDPYVCLFESCDSGEELYTHSQAWFKHMREHTLSWKCKSKSHALFSTSSREEYLAHMREAHPGKFSDAQLGVLANRNARAAGPLFETCPLCGTNEVNGVMEDHIVGHMRLLALKSLPSYEEDEDVNGDLNSHQGSGYNSASRSRSTLKHANFSDSDDSKSWDEEVSDSDDSKSWDEEVNLAWHPPLPSTWLESPAKPSTAERRRRPKPKKVTIRMDPDCAVCHASATAACDCEAKAFDIAVEQAESRTMTSIYNRMRIWARGKSQDYILSEFRELEGVARGDIPVGELPAGSLDEEHSLNRRIESLGDNAGEKDMEHFLRMVGTQSSGWENDNLRRRLWGASRKETPTSTSATHINAKEEQHGVSDLWEASFSRFPAVLDYYFSLSDWTLPPDDDPTVRDLTMGHLLFKKAMRDEDVDQGKVGDDEVKAKAKTDIQDPPMS